MYEVRLNKVNAERVLAQLYKGDSAAAKAIDDMLDALADNPAFCEHEPWPTETGSAFLAQVVGTDWFFAWTYPAEPGVVLVGKIFRFQRDLSD